VNLPLKDRKFDYLFVVFFSWAFVSSMISDAIPTLGVVESPHSSNILARINYSYASVNDPLFLHPPVWMRFVTGLSAFVYGPFYLLLVFGVELFGEAQWRTPHPVSFLAINSPYVLIPLLLIIRMRRPEPFARKF